VAANVAESAKCALFVADDDYRLTAHIDSEKTLRIGDSPFCAVLLSAWRVERANELPRAAKDASFFRIENRGLGIVLRSERVRGFDLFVNVELNGLSGHVRDKSTD